ILSKFTEDYTQQSAFMYAVFDYQRFIEPFLRLRERQRTIADGSFTLQIENGPKLKVSAAKGAASVKEITGDRAGDDPQTEFRLNSREILHFLFSPLAAQTIPAIGNSVFLQSLLPLPLFFEKIDSI
ncbi:MAG: hypothetical protein FWF26_03690, partial [Treponema sp.]|nr:hypothetical protein [Treponema sp.]